jgi:hypothetical protein
VSKKRGLGSFNPIWIGLDGFPVVILAMKLFPLKYI